MNKAVIFTLLFCFCSMPVYAGDVPQDVEDFIKKSAAQKYPNDYSTQLYVVKKEKAAYIDLSIISIHGCEPVIQDIVQSAEQRFQGDYSTQLYVVKKECAAYIQLR